MRKRLKEKPFASDPSHFPLWPVNVHNPGKNISLLAKSTPAVR
jgi:hypothetical protein